MWKYTRQDFLNEHGRFVVAKVPKWVIDNLYTRQKLTQVEIGKVLGIDQKTVSHIMIRHGVKSRHELQGWKRLCNKRDLIRWYKAGMTQAEIGKMLGCSYTPIQIAFKKFGIPTRKPKEWLGKRTRHLNSNWKGDGAMYKALHLRVYTERGSPKRCEICGTTDKHKRYDWHNPTKEYADIYKYVRVCRKCHRADHDRMWRVMASR